MRKSLPGGLGGIKMPSERGSGSAPNRPSMDAGRQRRLWEIDVRRGKLTPDRAEELAAQAGQPPFVRVTEQDRLAVQAAHWPLTLAIFWTAWEDVDQVARAWASFRFWKGHVWRNTNRPEQKHTLAESEHIILESLRLGSLKATAHFRDVRELILPETWIDAVWEDQLLKENFITANRNKIERALIESTPLHNAKIHNITNINMEPEKDLGGRNPEFDEVEFLLTAMKLVYDGNRKFTSQADLNREALYVYQQAQNLAHDKPSPAWGTPRIRRLWKFLELERPRKNP